MKIEKLYPVCKDYIWGGNKLKKKYGKITELTPCAESWELSFHKDGPTRISDGRTLMEAAYREDIGENASNFPYFPVLIKFIDAKADLSVQVHPSDEYALKNENSYGKTEMWYIVEAEEGAGIYLGFKENITRVEFEAAIKEKRLTELLNFYEVKPGECYFIPSGTIHAIAKGCLICEIQQNSNLTYRVYDYGRRDKFGNERELHIDKALAVTNLKKFTPLAFDDGILGKCEYFTVKSYTVSGARDFFAAHDSFNAVTCISGVGEIDGQTMKQGDTFFVPAGYGEYTVSGDVKILVTDV
ncbi:MAG: mannose-6-phosphate isomerase [Ruminococcaceae bacterium]|nr:mannose-6-phosphate isomerase [Oscillospiraceae bacterium]